MLYRLSLSVKRLVYLFIALYVVALFRPLAPFIEFELNKRYVQEFLCINKDQPITVCGGKCYLARQLKKANKQKQSKDAPHSSKVNLLDYPIGFVELNKLNCADSSAITHNTYYPSIYFKLLADDIFHPPIV